MVKKFTFSPFQENTYLLYDEGGQAVVIDPGCLFQEEKEELGQYIKEQKLTLKAVLQTHTHLDHVFGSQYIKRNFKVPMWMHKADLPILEDVEKRCEMYGIPGYEPVEPDAFLEEGDVLEIGEIRLEVIFVPGHAPGHIAFVNRAEKYIIGGDCLFRESVGRTDFPLCSHSDLMHSIQTKFFSLPDDFLVYAGHMDETTIGHEKKFNPFLKS
ncbi:MBL fold metallo-hydrolase [Marinilongibacter aquaticus]|nr:MBL fold metallo-hydrolase [Marinilongibacter aquaticus]